MKLEQIKKYENNYGRANDFVNAFIDGEKWNNYVNRINRLSKITKQDIIDFAKKYYGENYVVIYKRTGIDSTIKKIDKPEISPVETNRNEQSDFLKKIINTPVNEIEPQFLDYTKDIKSFSVRKNIPVFFTENKENKTFSMYYIFDMGSNHDKKLPIAIQYLPFLGTSKYTPAQVQEEFYKLACNFGVFNSDDQVYVSLNGLTENFDKALQLFEHLLSDAKPNSDALQNLVLDILKNRTDDKLDKNSILRSAMYNYGVYGIKSPFTNILSEKELKALNPEELISIIHSLNSYQHRILCYSSMTQDELSKSLNTYHKTPDVMKPLPVETKFEELPTSENKIFAIDYDMKQAEIMFISKSENYDKNIVPQISIYNEYFGGGMSSIVFQELRESKALAYSVRSYYQQASRKDKANYILSYIGSQADKLLEAMDGLYNLMKKMPESNVAFSASKNSILQNLRSTRITRTQILFSYESAKKLGLDYDIRKDVYSKVTNFNIDDVKKFQEEHVKNKSYTILVLGKKDLLDQKVLEKYGPVKWLTLQEVFGY
ncbi:MAG: insulinase family protein [Bacteroidota bacterium]